MGGRAMESGPQPGPMGKRRPVVGEDRSVGTTTIEPEPFTDSDVVAHIGGILRGVPVDVADEVRRMADLLVARYRQDPAADLRRLGRRLVGTARELEPEPERADDPAAESESTPEENEPADRPSVFERITTAVEGLSRWHAKDLADLVEKKLNPTERMSRRCSPRDRITRAVLELTDEGREQAVATIEKYVDAMKAAIDTKLFPAPPSAPQAAEAQATPEAPKDTRPWWERLGELLAARFYNLAKLGRSLGWKPGRLQRIVRQHSEPNIDEAMQLCQHLRVPVMEIFG